MPVAETRPDHWDLRPPADVPDDPPPAPVWAVAELLGHNRHAGILTEEVRFGGVCNRVDELRPDGTFATVYFGHAAIFRITLATERFVRAMVGHQAAARRPSPLALPARDEDYEDDDEDFDNFNL